MLKKLFLITFLGLFLFLSVSEEKNDISGNLTDGLRVISLKGIKELDITVYRGDYLIFDSGETNILNLSIPDLDINHEILPKLSDNQYIKMKTSGKFSIKIGNISGIIKIIDLKDPTYKEVTAMEALNLIENIKPLILDVRTQGEYNSGHINDSMLLPVQVLKSNLNKLADYKNEPVFIYCQSGNRSTVASKILMDNGFTKIYNLRYGIGDWKSRGLPITKD